MKDWMLNKPKPKYRNPDELFSDLDEKMQKALELANKLEGSPKPSFWKYFQIRKKDDVVRK